MKCYYTSMYNKMNKLTLKLSFDKPDHELALIKQELDAEKPSKSNKPLKDDYYVLSSDKIRYTSLFSYLVSFGVHVLFRNISYDEIDTSLMSLDEAKLTLRKMIDNSVLNAIMITPINLVVIKNGQPNKHYQTLRIKASGINYYVYNADHVYNSVKCDGETLLGNYEPIVFKCIDSSHKEPIRWVPKRYYKYRKHKSLLIDVPVSAIGLPYCSYFRPINLERYQNEKIRKFGKIRSTGRKYLLLGGSITIGNYIYESSNNQVSFERLVGYIDLSFYVIVKSILIIDIKSSYTLPPFNCFILASKTFNISTEEMKPNMWHLSRKSQSVKINKKATIIIVIFDLVGDQDQ